MVTVSMRYHPKIPLFSVSISVSHSHSQYPNAALLSCSLAQFFETPNYKTLVIVSLYFVCSDKTNVSLEAAVMVSACAEENVLFMFRF